MVSVVERIEEYIIGISPEGRDTLTHEVHRSGQFECGLSGSTLIEYDCCYCFCCLSGWLTTRDRKGSLNVQVRKSADVSMLCT